MLTTDEQLNAELAQSFQLFDTKTTALAETVGKAIGKMWWEAERVRALTADFTVAPEAVVPEWRQLIITASSVYNEAARVLNDLGYSSTREVFVRCNKPAADYMKSVIEYINALVRNDQSVMDRWNAALDAHGLRPKPLPVDTASNDTQQPTADAGQEAAVN